MSDPATKVRKVPNKKGTPERWQEALKRAKKGNITVWQAVDSGLWFASSGTERGKAYTLSVIGPVAFDCSCEAAQHGDEVCAHRAAFYNHVGSLGHIEDVEEAEQEEIERLIDALDAAERFDLSDYCQFCGSRKDDHDWKACQE